MKFDDNEQKPVMATPEMGRQIVALGGIFFRKTGTGTETGMTKTTGLTRNGTR